MPTFKITYKTSTDELFELVIPNAFDFDETKPADVAKVNTAARNILNANAIKLNSGNLQSIESIEFCISDISTYDVSGM